MAEQTNALGFTDEEVAEIAQQAADSIGLMWKDMGDERRAEYIELTVAAFENRDIPEHLLKDVAINDVRVSAGREFMRHVMHEFRKSPKWDENRYARALQTIL